MLIEKGNPSMGMLQSYSYPVIPLPPYPVSCPATIAPLSRYPFIPEDSQCES